MVAALVTPEEIQDALDEMVADGTVVEVGENSATYYALAVDRTVSDDEYAEPDEYEFEGHKFAWKNRGYSWAWELEVDGNVVPKDVQQAVAEVEDDNIRRRVVIYWMNRQGECCRYCDWLDASSERHGLEVLLSEDERRKRIDPEKLTPEQHLELTNRYLDALTRECNLEEGAMAIYEEREPEVYTPDRFSSKAKSKADQYALLTMPEEKRAAVVRPSRPAPTTPAPVQQQMQLGFGL